MVLFIFAELFEKLIMRYLETLINVSDFLFGLKNTHSIIDHIHRLLTIIEKSFEEKKYCTAMIVDVWQAFDSVSFGWMVRSKED